MLTVSDSDYAAIFIILILVWPSYFLQNPWLFGICLLINTIIFISVIYATSSNRLSFWKGIRRIVIPYMSGYANLTIVYVFFILLFHYIKAIYTTIIGVFKGKSYVEIWWSETVDKSPPKEVSGSVLAQSIFVFFGALLSISGFSTLAGAVLNLFSKISGYSLGLNRNIETYNLILLAVFGLASLLVGIWILRSAIIKLRSKK